MIGAINGNFAFLPTKICLNFSKNGEVEDCFISHLKGGHRAYPGVLTLHPKKVLILTDGDTDGVCSAAIAKTAYPEADIEFINNPPELPSALGSLSGYDLVVIMDLGINSAQKAEAIEAFRKLSETSDIIYIDHHQHPPGVTMRSLACKAMPYRTDVSTSELAWEFFKPPPFFDFIAVLGAIGDYQEKTPRMQKLVEKHGERKAYPEALFLDCALAVSEDSFKRKVIYELTQGKWPLDIFPLEEQASRAVRRRKMVERYVRENAERVCEHVMLVRDVPFEATGLAANLVTKLNNTDVGIGAAQRGDYVHLSTRRHKGSDINLASLMEETTQRLGGGGGGHDAAAGGRVPVERFDEFLEEVKRALTGLKNTENNKTGGDE